MGILDKHLNHNLPEHDMLIMAGFELNFSYPTNHGKIYHYKKFLGEQHMCVVTYTPKNKKRRFAVEIVGPEYSFQTFPRFNTTAVQDLIEKLNDFEKGLDC